MSGGGRARQGSEADVAEAETTPGRKVDTVEEVPPTDSVAVVDSAIR